MSKNIIIFSDGTGKEGGKGNNTNVYKLFNMAENRTNNQIIFYDRGLGTDGTGWRKIWGAVASLGIAKNIQDCYKFIFDNYLAGDQIFLFGFSRGATTVRSLSSFIHHFGILPKSRPELIVEAYNIYAERPKEHNEKKLKEWRETVKNFISRNHTMWTNIKFLGVWDTVAALGLPIKMLDVVINFIPGLQHNYHDLHLSECVIHARHALAIDDERLTFHPKVWDAKIANKQTLKQVWFCGMHTDVGGGYEEQNLSDIPLLWMIYEAKEKGLAIYPYHKIKLNPDPDGYMHNSRDGFFIKYYKKLSRFWDTEKQGEPIVHESVLKRKNNTRNSADSEYNPWILNIKYKVEKEEVNIL